ncbi:MAG: SGNH/GDSL hydrolase family protein [Bacteroidetes bacterium]|nr:SGNH/GDSL hydrolase family protein [Bacteroidota bacterium]
MEQLKKRKRWWYAVFLFAFFLAVLEVTGRIYLKYFLQKSATPKFRFNSFRIYEHVPGFREGDKSGNWIEINQQGFRRSSDVLMQKPLNTLRIFLMGASSAHGISSAAPFPVRHIYNNETIDVFLENLLEKEFKKKNIEVINAAVTGYQFFQQTNYLMNEIVKYDPDMIIFFDGANDCYMSNPAYNYFDWNKFQFWKKRLQQPSLSGIFDYAMLWCSKFSAFARGYLSWKGIKEAENIASVNPPHIKDANGKTLLQNHQQVVLKTWLPVLQTNFNILKQHKIKTVFALQPMLVLRNQAL